MGRRKGRGRIIFGVVIIGVAFLLFSGVDLGDLGDLFKGESGFSAGWSLRKEGDDPGLTVTLYDPACIPPGPCSHIMQPNEILDIYPVWRLDTLQDIVVATWTINVGAKWNVDGGPYMMMVGCLETDPFPLDTNLHLMKGSPCMKSFGYFVLDAYPVGSHTIRYEVVGELRITTDKNTLIQRFGDGWVEIRFIIEEDGTVGDLHTDGGWNLY